ncbi:MAG: oligosaccharide flippase family protein [Parasporobacterium sp.]|nr:oligosaccharide flippase family protein [Parasporobacterium sp.]
MKGVTFLTTPIFARLLTHSEYGLFNNYTSWLSALTVVITLNLDATFISAKFDFKEKFDEYILSTIVLSSFSGVFWLIIILLFPNQISAITGIDNKYLLIMIVYLIALPAVNMFQSRERYSYKYKISVFLSLFITISTAVVSIILVTNLEDRLDGRILGSAIPTIIVGALLYIFIVIKGKRINYRYWKYALPVCLPFIPHLLSLTLLNTMDRMMITQICGSEDTALYSIAYTCGTIITLLITAMNGAIAPWLGQKLSEERIDEIRSISKKYILLFVSLASGLMLITPEILLLMGGKSYLDAIYVMPPVAFGCVCQFMYTMYVNVEQFKKKTIGMGIASVSAALLNYGLNYWLIPKFGYIAAAYTTLISFLWLLLVHMFLVRRIGYRRVYPTKFVLLVTLAMSIYTVLVNFLYGLTIIRYVIIGIYIILLIYFIVKYKSVIMRLIKRG